MADTKILDVYIPCQTCGKLIPAGGDNRCLTCRLIDLALEPKLKWIPVTERLPEKCEPVLACFDFMGGKVVKASDRYGKNGLLWSGIPCGGKVTHWMPLPEPPKGE
jgi:hypothetical protein